MLESKRIVWGTLGINLHLGLQNAKSGKSVKITDSDGIATSSFNGFCKSALDKMNRVNCGGLPLIVGKSSQVYDGINTMHSSIEGCLSPSYGDMSMKINDYLLKNKQVPLTNFYPQYLPFIRACWSASRNVLVDPSVRTSWKGGRMEDAAKKYGEFIEFLRG